MSINYQKVIELCKKDGNLILYEDGDMQWISDGYACWPLLKMPHMNEEAVRAVYSLSAKVKVEERGALPIHLCFADVVRQEQPVFYEKIQMQPIGMPLVSLRTSAGVTFIEQKYIKPLEPGENGDCMLYERTDGRGNVYIVAKQGLMVEAIILPRQGVLRADWLDDLQSLLVALRQTFEKEAGQ